MNLFFLLESGESVNWVTEGVTALISGMSTVFIILIMISVVIGLFKYLKVADISHEHKPERISANIEIHEENAIHENAVPKTAAIDDLELIAVIMAAIAASLNTTTDKLQVKSFRRVSTKNSLSR